MSIITHRSVKVGSFSRATITLQQSEEERERERQTCVITVTSKGVGGAHIHGDAVPQEALDCAGGLCAFRINKLAQCDSPTVVLCITHMHAPPTSRMVAPCCRAGARTSGSMPCMQQEWVQCSIVPV